jgi:homoserine dehydrogenase
MPTASAVVGDVINLAGALKLPDFAPYFHPPIESKEPTVSPMDAAESAFYVRLETADTPGVMGHLGHALGGHEVNLHSIIQRGIPGGGGATIILLTRRANERNMNRALREIEAQATTRQIGVVLRLFE